MTARLPGPAGPASPPPPRNPAPLPRPVPPPPPPRPTRVLSLRLAAAFPVIGVLSIAAGATGYSLLRAAVVLASYVFLHVSLAHLPAPRHRLLRFARAHVGAGVLRGAPAPTSNSPDGPALAASTLVGRETAALPG